MQIKLDAISSIVARDGKAKIHNIIHLLGVENLAGCFGRLKRGKAVGIDGVDIPEYEKNLVPNLQNLVGRVKSWSYRPQPVRRVNIPKPNGKTRPLGIPSVEDKIVQVGIARILESIYEVDFQDCSYGFRPKRGCHQALNRLDKIIMSQPINYIIDADIKGFFDNVNHQWMQKFLEHRIADQDFIRLINRFLKIGFTHFIDKTLKGGFKLGRKTDSKKMRNSLKALNQWLKQSRNLEKINVLWKKLHSKLRGHFQYYGVSGNYRSIGIYRNRALQLTYKWINRRSQKKSFSWVSFCEYMKRYPLPKAQIHHNFYTLGVLM